MSGSSFALVTPEQARLFSEYRDVENRLTGIYIQTIEQKILKINCVSQ